jgi:ADP-ribosylglycohydrolase
MKRIPDHYVEKVYAGWLGKIIGVRHGSNIEGWSYEKIRDTYGEITGYLFDFKNFAADDDTNGPLFFLRALGDYQCTVELSEENVGYTWLNYVPYEHGFYWWGGYGISTEHTAYLNLRSGIKAPRSGSVDQNGATIAEQIGGQIFIDTCGLIIPCDYRLAAKFAKGVASVSHDGNGVYGGMFVAACISAAFKESDVQAVIRAGLSVIPQECEYHKMAEDIISFHGSNPENWRACFEYVKNNYGYERYDGNCHIIPNSAVIVLSMLYGSGNFSKTINICNMCGWDTDCNVGNVGTILGVMVGLEGIDNKWRKPINDLLICSSVIGSLNITDISTCACYIADLGYKLAGEKPADEWMDIVSGKGAKYHFELSGSTHAFRICVDSDNVTDYHLEHTTVTAHTGKGALKVTGKLEKNSREAYCIRTFYKTYYRPEDFNDSRYDPAFSPTLYPGQRIQAYVMLNNSSDVGTEACLYVFDGNNQRQYCSKAQKLSGGKWMKLSYDIPSLSGACIEEAGIKMIGNDAKSSLLTVYIDDFDIQGIPDYTLDFSKERMEKWNGMHQEVSQFTYLKGIWKLENSELSGSCSDFGEAYTGAYMLRDYTVEAWMIPKIGEHHNINFRVQGSIRSYAAGLGPGKKLVLYKNCNGYQILKEIDYEWKLNEEYLFRISLNGSKITVSDALNILIEYEDMDDPYLTGQVGCSVLHGSHCHYKSFRISPNAISD